MEELENPLREVVMTGGEKMVSFSQGLWRKD
jgi:hypothetical protein